jgi:acyl carrier protein
METLTLEKIQEDILSIFKSTLGIDNINADQGLVSLGGDSITAVYISELIDEKYSCLLSVRRIYQFSTPNKIALFIFDQQTKGSS